MKSQITNWFGTLTGNVKRHGVSVSPSASFSELGGAVALQIVRDADKHPNATLTMTEDDARSLVRGLTSQLKWIDKIRAETEKLP